MSTFYLTVAGYDFTAECEVVDGRCMSEYHLSAVCPTGECKENFASRAFSSTKATENLLLDMFKHLRYAH